MSEQTEITDEMIAAYQRKQAQDEQQRRYALIQELAQLANERGYEIIAAPQFTEDGRISAAWGVQKVAK